MSIIAGETVERYEQFLLNKSNVGSDSGFDPTWMPDFLFDFQSALLEFAIRKGRSAIFADCGLGKTPMGLTWAFNVFQHTGKPVLYLTPLAVGKQTVREGDKFGIDAKQSRTGEVHRPITIANYEALHHFSPGDFGGVVCDESSILKSFNGERRKQITSFMRKTKYRLLQTATAAPNDYIELGTSSEALGYLGHTDMLNRFFSNNLNNSAQGRFRGEVIKWRLKGHAEIPFWQWVCSWARAVRNPSDLGFDDADFLLPSLNEVEHLVETEKLAEGMLFNLPAIGLQEQREERRRSLNERCAVTADIANASTDPVLVWCQLNDEGNLLARLIPDAVQVAGSDADSVKEDRLEAFGDGRARVLITKPKIGAWGLNYQHCNHMTFFPSHSFEQYYQSVRRCWRFGQKRDVTVDIIMTEGDRNITENMKRKQEQASAMFTNLIAEMNNAVSVEASTKPNHRTEIPSWL